MKIDTETVMIMGKSFLKCQRETCEWNIGWLAGLEWTEESGLGTRICNLGARAMLEDNALPPDDCPQFQAVLELARNEFFI